MIHNLRNVRPPRTFNWCLAAPEAWKHPSAQLSVNDYAVGAGRLRQALVEIVQNEPRTRIHEHDVEELRLEIEERSRVFGFRDLIDVEIQSLGPERSTLGLYSRSTLGFIDLGVNRRRIERWLNILDSRLPLAE